MKIWAVEYRTLSGAFLFIGAYSKQEIAQSKVERFEAAAGTTLDGWTPDGNGFKATFSKSFGCDEIKRREYLVYPVVVDGDILRETTR